MTPRLLPCGPDALIAQYADAAEVRAAAASLAADPPAGVAEVVPAARTVLLVLHPGADPAVVAGAVRARRAAAVAPATEPAIVVPVVYDGPDLDEVAEHLAVSPDDVVALHTGQVWTVAFCGFVPGFGYLTGEHDRLHVPRRGSPRTRVPAGSVGLAAEFTGVYPRASPGGWQVIGRTDLELWDPRREPPALFRPGVRVRFEAAR